MVTLKMLNVSDMSKILNRLSIYNAVRAEIEEDELRSLLFDHLAESVRIYYLGCEMQMLLRLQLAFGLEGHLFDVMLTKAVMVSEARDEIRTRLSFVETEGLRDCMTEITARLDRKSIIYKRSAFKRIGRKSKRNKDGFKRTASSLVEKYFSKQGQLMELDV